MEPTRKSITSPQSPSRNPTNKHGEKSQLPTNAFNLFHIEQTDPSIKTEENSVTINQSPRTKTYASGLLKTPIPNGNAQEISIDGTLLGIKHAPRKEKILDATSPDNHKHRGEKVAKSSFGTVYKHGKNDTIYKKFESFRKPKWLPNDTTNEKYTKIFNEEAKKLYATCQNSGVNIFVNFISGIKGNRVKYIVPTNPDLKETQLTDDEYNESPIFIEQTMLGHKAGGIFLDNKPHNWLNKTRIDTDFDIELLVFFRLWQAKIDKGENFTFDEVRKAISKGNLGEFCTLHPNNLKILLCDNDTPQPDNTLKYLRLQGLFGACITMAGGVLNKELSEHRNYLAENPMFWKANSLEEIKNILEKYLPDIKLPNAPNFRDELIEFMLAFKDSSNFTEFKDEDDELKKTSYKNVQKNIKTIKIFMDKYDNYIKDWGITASSIPENLNTSINSSISENVTPNTSSIPENLNTSINSSISENSNASINSSIPENLNTSINSSIPENLNTSINSSISENVTPNTSSISEKSNAGKSNKHRKTKPQKTRTPLKSIIKSIIKFIFKSIFISLTRFFSRK